ncbi:MAG: carboxymuconolactone decarboxylase family protein [Spirochaetota bacterium]|nr:carboxymuconolactone decarboxylase family protein [Spirochaetota bacterium]
MANNPLHIIESNDKELYRHIEQGRDLALEPGALGAKEKLLIAAALDAARGAANGVRALAGQAMAAGATKEEVMEAMRVAAYISGVGSVYTAAAGLDGLF